MVVYVDIYEIYHNSMWYYCVRCVSTGLWLQTNANANAIAQSARTRLAVSHFCVSYIYIWMFRTIMYIGTSCYGIITHFCDTKEYIQSSYTHPPLCSSYRMNYMCSERRRETRLDLCLYIVLEAIAQWQSAAGPCVSTDVGAGSTYDDEPSRIICVYISRSIRDLQMYHMNRITWRPRRTSNMESFTYFK